MVNTGTTVACYSTHWSPREGVNTIRSRCEHCGRALGVTDGRLAPLDMWRPYTRVVVSNAAITEAGETMLTTDITNWCPPCWGAEGLAAMRGRYPTTDFTELEIPHS